MADGGSCSPVGYILVNNNFHVFDQCTTYCYSKKINYHSTYDVYEQSRSETLYFVYFYSKKEATDVINFMKKLDVKYLYVNVVAQ